MPQAANGVVLRVGVAQRPLRLRTIARLHAQDHVGHRLPGGEHAFKRHLVAWHRLPVFAQQPPVGRQRIGHRRMRLALAPAQKAPRRVVDAGQCLVGPEHHHAGAQVFDQRPGVGLADLQHLPRPIALLLQAQRDQRTEDHQAQQHIDHRDQQEHGHRRAGARTRGADGQEPDAHRQPGQPQELEPGDPAQHLQLQDAVKGVEAADVAQSHAGDHDPCHGKQGLARRHRVPDRGQQHIANEHGQQGGQHRSQRVGLPQVAAKSDPQERPAGDERGVGHAKGEQLGPVGAQPQPHRTQGREQP
ncbi:hypothetical protein FQZ97_661930 [compost metagenome]